MRKTEQEERFMKTKNKISMMKYKLLNTAAEESLPSQKNRSEVKGVGKKKGSEEEELHKLVRKKRDVDNKTRKNIRDPTKQQQPVENKPIKCKRPRCC